MSKKLWVSVNCGLVRDPKHRNRMGKLLWLYLHMLDIVNWQDGVIYGWKDEAAAEALEMQLRTLREQRRELEELGYIVCIKRQYGQDITILNWTNPREYKRDSEEMTPAEEFQSYIQSYIQSDKKDVTPTSNSKEQINKGKEKMKLDPLAEQWENSLSGKPSKKQILKMMFEAIDMYRAEKEGDDMQNKQWDDMHDFPAELKPIVKKLEKGLGLSNLMRDENAVEVYRWVAEQKGLDTFITWATAPERAQFVGKYKKNPGLIKVEWQSAFVKTSSESRVALLETIGDDSEPIS